MSRIVLQYFELQFSAPFWGKMKTEVNVAEFSNGSPAKRSIDESSGHFAIARLGKVFDSTGSPDVLFMEYC